MTFNSRPRTTIVAVGSAVLLVALGYVTVLRATSGRLPRTDFTVYMAGAQAVLRGGSELYTATDIHGWHYTMPPLFAICAVPLALLPAAVAVALWYAITIVCLALSVGLILRMTTPPGARPSPSIAVIPLLICADPLLDTISRSQTGTLMLALCVAALASYRSDKRFASGLLVALATTLKVYSGLIVLYFACRKDWRALAGCLAGFALFGVAIPAAALGPSEAATAWRTWFTQVVAPYAQPFGAPLPYAELQHYSIAKNQSLPGTLTHMAAILRGGSLDAGDWWVQLVVAIACAAFLVALWLAWRRRASAVDQEQLLDWPLAAMLGLLLLPTAWSHYFSLLVLPLAVLQARLLRAGDERARTALARTRTLVAVLAGVFTLSSIVLPMVDSDPTWRARVLLLRSTGPLCWATVAISLAFLWLRLRREPLRFAGSPNETR